MRCYGFVEVCSAYLGSANQAAETDMTDNQVNARFTLGPTDSAS